MSAIYDTNLPVTGICLVSKPNNVPTGYQCIRKSNKEIDNFVNRINLSNEVKVDFCCNTRPRGKWNCFYNNLQYST